MNREDLNDLRPFDILHSFGAMRSHLQAAGEGMRRMFSDAKAYRSFLFVAQEWVLENSFPTTNPQTVHCQPAEGRGRNACSSEHVLESADRRIGDMVPQLDAPIRETRNPV